MNNTVYKSEASRDHFRSCCSQILSHLIPNCSHVVTQDAPLIIPFLGKGSCELRAVILYLSLNQPFNSEISKKPGRSLH